MEDYFNANKAQWDQRVEGHLESKMYDMQGFLRGKSSLRHPEQEYLKEIKGKSLLHLQCHFGQDSLSMQRLGAQVTGLDISSEAIKKARELNSQLSLDAKFVECNVTEAHLHIHEQFDYVFTSYGTIVWIPSLEQWAKNIFNFLKPNGTFLMVDFHPAMYMLDDNFDQLAYPYFTQEKPFKDVVEESYTENKVKINGEQYFWNHPTSAVMSSLLENNMELKVFKELPYSCYNCFPNMEKIADQKYQFTKHKGNIPYTFLMLWQKKSL